MSHIRTSSMLLDPVLSHSFSLPLPGAALWREDRFPHLALTADAACPGCYAVCAR